MELRDKVAVVTGGSRGIGRAICLALAEEKCILAVNFLSNTTAADDVVKQLKSMGVKAKAFQGDVADLEQARSLAGRIQDEFGQVDILVNNAGITRDKSFLKMSREQWDSVLLVNLTGPFNMTHEFLPGMVERRWGRIVNITSIVAQMGNFGQSNYAVAKGGLIAFTRTLAREVATKGVTVNAVSPGFIDTDMTSELPEAVLETVKRLTPMGRLGRSEEVASAVRFLAAAESSFITGEVINVNGGLYMG
jgi:3-oxoacyl-(acyl-carrier-protein) reductase